ncbi:L-seryl-tRNA(Sec) kinase [Drosophila takahashii]|uniref:L-seryl-tRNA(Sec) kinase n=1 Tax=Drosophila takahashii TaxID=29030 RepID=UPI001CF842BA|nr:L-seryl-tRNA(Sec) kinase [Drosophila takahashii]
MQCICLVALIGLPGAGKSTLCTWLLGQQAALLHFRHIVHLCYDDFLDIRLPYKEQRGLILNLLEQLIAAIQADTIWPAQIQRIAFSSSGKHILILCDDNFYYRSMRQQLQQLCRRSNGCIYGQLHIASSLDVCLTKNSKRSGGFRVPAAVIRQMNERLEAPGCEAWERNSLTIHNLNDKDAILDFINSLPAKESSPSSTNSRQPAQEQTLIHKLDLLLRARIKELLNDVKEKQLAGSRLNNKRKEILTRWRGEQRNGQAENEAALDYYVNLLN